MRFVCSARGRFSRIREHEALEKWLRPEEQQKTDLDIGGPKVVKKLFSIGLAETSPSLCLDDHLVLDKKVGPRFQR
jgi:hypothetical protein